MKNLIYLLPLLLFSCTEPTRENSVKNPSETTTVYLQSLPKDTLIVSYESKKENPYIYVWNDGLITEVHTISNQSTIDDILISDFVIVILMVLIFGLGLGGYIGNNS